jgi:lipopolysaccharide export system protein LptA
MQIKTIIYVFLAISLVLFPTLAQETTDKSMTEAEGDALKRAKAEEGAAEETKGVYTVTADETEGSFSAAGKTIHAIGNVVITHGKTTITCNEAWSYETENLFTLKGNVKVVDTEKDYILTSEYTEYHRDTEVAVATKGPVLTLVGDKDIVITSDIMRMNMKTEYGEAAGNCEVKSEDITAVGDTLHYYGGEENERIILDGSPVVWQSDSRLAGRLITMYLSGDDVDRVLIEEDAHLVYFAKEEESEEEAELNKTLDAELGLIEGETAVESGEETENDYGAGDGEAIEVIEIAEDVEDDTVELFGGDPDLSEAVEDEVVATDTGENEDEEEKVNGKVEAIGDVIDALFIDGEIDKVIVEGDARGIYSPYDEFGFLTGEEMDTSGDIITMSFRDGAARKILVEGEAVGVYNPGETGGRAGLTRSEGDTISIYISNNDVRRMVVFGSAHGSYFTEEAAAEEEGQADAAKRDSGPQNN